MQVRAQFKAIDRGWRRVRDAARSMEKGAYVKVGLMDGHKDRPAEDGVTNAQLGAIHEFGSSDGRVPARPFLFPATKNAIPRHKKLIGAGLRLMFHGRMTLPRLLGLLGAQAAVDVKNYVTQGSPIPPPNAPSTLARKIKRGAAEKVRTLIDTGRMLAAISWAVVLGTTEQRPGK